MADKFERTGLHAVKSGRVNAPVIAEYPVTLEEYQAWQIHIVEG